MQCSRCGRPVSPQDRRCSLCGEELTGATESDQPRSLFAPRPAAPEPSPTDETSTTADYSTAAEDFTAEPDDRFSPFHHRYETGPRPTSGYSPAPDPEPEFHDRGPQPIMIPLIVALALILGLGLGVVAWWLIARSEPTVASQRPAAISSQSSGNETSADSSPSESAPDPADLPPAENLSDQAAATADATSADGVDSAKERVSYSAANLTDGELETAWRMKGDGSGRSIQFRFTQPVSITALALTNGYTKQDSGNGANRYQEERRITQVTWTTDDGSTFEQELTDATWDLQRLQIEETSTSTLTLTITDTTAPGDPKRDYTAISEVEITGRSS